MLEEPSFFKYKGRDIHRRILLHLYLIVIVYWEITYGYLLFSKEYKVVEVVIRYEIYALVLACLQFYKSQRTFNTESLY